MDQEITTEKQNLIYTIPLKVASAIAEKEIVYKRLVDPVTQILSDAVTNLVWGAEQVGNTWWNTTLKYFEYENFDHTIQTKNIGVRYSG